MRIHYKLDQLPTFNNAVITIGSYDGVHIGHQKILAKLIKKSKELRGESVVITFDPHPRKVIYPKDHSLNLLTNLDEKIEVFRKIGVDHLVIAPFSVEFSQISPREYIEDFLIKNFSPRCIIIGYDHRFGLNRAGNIHLLKEYSQSQGFELIQIEKQELDEITVSSTKIRNAINEGNVGLASKLLNRKYNLSGKVIHGEKIGTKLGFPTANIGHIDSDKLIPQVGIYAVYVYLENHRFDGMLYIGNKPTLKGDRNKFIEVHIFDFKENIYGQNITIDFVEFIRDDIQFETIGELTQQLHLDQEKAQAILASKRKNSSSIAIVILNHNGENHLDAYLPSVLKSSSNLIDIYVIDNGSSDGSVEFLKEWFPEVKVISLEKNLGFAGGYNEGLKQIDAEYYVILNSDVKVTENWLDPIENLLQNDHTIAAIQPKILSIEEPNYFEYAGAAGGLIDALGYPFCRGRVLAHIEQDNGQYDTKQNIAWASGAALVIRTHIFHTLGGFDADFFAHQEEIDLCWRVRKAGYSIAYCPQSVVYHLGGGTLEYESPYKTYLNFRNNHAMLWKNESWSKLLWLIPLRLALDGLAGFHFLLIGKISHIWSIIKAHFYVYLHLPSILRKRCKYNELIEKKRIDKENNDGVWSGSILYNYYFKNKKTATEILHEEK